MDQVIDGTHSEALFVEGYSPLVMKNEQGNQVRKVLLFSDVLVRHILH